MSQKDALRFIERVSVDLELQGKLRALPSPADLGQVVGLAREAGFSFDVDDLRAAFLTDWRLRRRYYSSISGSPGAKAP